MFYVHLIGEEGYECGNQCGCNRKWKKLKGITVDEANEEVASIIDKINRDNRRNGHDHGIGKAFILDVVISEEFDMKSYKDNLKARKLQKLKEQELKKQEEERALRKSQYDKLKAEFDPEGLPSDDLLGTKLPKQAEETSEEDEEENDDDENDDDDGIPDLLK